MISREVFLLPGFYIRDVTEILPSLVLFTGLSPAVVSCGQQRYRREESEEGPEGLQGPGEAVRNSGA